MKLKNKYYILRHGEALSNVMKVSSSWPEKFKNPLTKHGKEVIMAVAEILKDKRIDDIFTSDLLRTKQTAEIVGKELNIRAKFDKRLREIDFGNMNGRPAKDLDVAFKKESLRISRAMPRGENYQEVVKRGFAFLKDMEKRFTGKNILIVSHESLLWMLEAKVHGISLSKALKLIPREQRIHKGQMKELN